MYNVDTTSLKKNIYKYTYTYLPPTYRKTRVHSEKCAIQKYFISPIYTHIYPNTHMLTSIGFIEDRSSHSILSQTWWLQRPTNILIVVSWPLFFIGRYVTIILIVNRILFCNFMYTIYYIYFSVMAYRWAVVSRYPRIYRYLI